MTKPKYDKRKKIDSWICCWCGEDNNHQGDLNDFDYAVGSIITKCRKCEKENNVMFSIEYLSQPIEE